MNPPQQDITLREEVRVQKGCLGQNVRVWLSLLKAKHWVKNILLFAAPFFGGYLFHPFTVSSAFTAFAAFCLCASAGYIVNDVKDADKDRLHPRKSTRPVASGKVKPGTAFAVAGLLTAVAFALSFVISPIFFAYLAAYLAVQLAYSLFLKDVPLLDIFAIASGFVLRVLAGGAAFHVEVSQWLFVTMFMISLTLASGKRLCEVRLLDDKAGEHRASLNHYSPALLNEILLVAASASLLTYALYTVEQSRNLVYTVPIVVLGLFRYIMVSKQGLGDPVEALTRDKWLAMTVTAWLVLVGVMRYTRAS